MKKSELVSIINRIKRYHEFQLKHHASAFIKVRSNGKGIDLLAEGLSKALFTGMDVPIVRLEGEDPNTSFESIKGTSDMVIVPNVGMRLVRDFVFPENKPVLIAISSFNLMKGTDQGGFAELGDEKPDRVRKQWNIYEGSVIIAGIDQSDKNVDPRAREKGILLEPPFHFENE